ncbi:MAG TPA: LysM peptidoglycan-binding domain-containing protein [Chloroflexia bacterium]|nr:LysM peptidoglycan-binding domain-containing protein [Chloroflexia bacterium]
MAGHGGGGGGGHGGGGGGGHGGGGGGVRKAVASNGCLRYIALYVVALFLLIILAIAGGLGWFSHIPLIGGILAQTNTPSITTSSRALAAAPAAAAPAAPVANVPAASSGGGAATTAPRAMTNSVPLPGAQGALITPMTAPAFYIVQPKDTLDTVAAAFGTTRDLLSSYNRLSDSMLYVGQVLYLPPLVRNQVPNTGRNAGRQDGAPSDAPDPNASPR